MISHDRWLLDRVATHILAFEDDGTQVQTPPQSQGALQALIPCMRSRGNSCTALAGCIY